MVKKNYLPDILIIVIFPLMVLLLSFNFALRTSETYVFYFNDSQAVTKSGTTKTGTDVAKEITAYWNSLGNEKFQIYEENGEFKDRFFDAKEVAIMGKFKTIFRVCLIAGLASLITFVLIYKKFSDLLSKKRLRRAGIIAAGISGVMVTINAVLIANKSFLLGVYNKTVGINPGKRSMLVMLLGGDFHKTFDLFQTVIAVVIIAIFVYINLKQTKEDRIFF